MSAAGVLRATAPPARNGVGPSCVVLPLGPWATVAEFLMHRFPHVTPDQWHQRLARGDVVDELGQAVGAKATFAAGQRVYYYRDLIAEPRIPFDEVVLHQDAHLLVVDKPHFLPVMPSGKYLQETVLVRLKNRLGLPNLVPIHRIDRDTAGLVLFSIQAQTRNAYHALFRDRQVSKTYEAIAPWNPDLAWPVTRETRMVEATHFMQQAEVEGPPNTRTHIAPLQVHAGFARYALKPVTGHRHQLRVHMAGLGLPIVGDGIYPVLTPEGQVDHDHPLQLLAQSIEFVDPLSGQTRRFQSQRSLRALETIFS